MTGHKWATPGERASDVLPGVGIALGAGVGAIAGMAAGGAPGIAVGMALGSGVGVVIAGVMWLRSRDRRQETDARKASRRSSRH